jgi:hypothetical protein
MRVCKGYGSDYVLATRRTNHNTTYIKCIKNLRQFKICPNEIFDEEYKIINHSTSAVAETWLKSTIKMTEMVRKELEMKVALSKRKIIAILEDDAELPEGTVEVINSYEDLEGKPLKELLRLVNMTKGKDDKVKAFVEGDNPPMMTWAKMVEFEVPTKATPVAKEKVSVKITDATIFTALDNKQNRGDSIRTQVYNALAGLPDGSGNLAEIADAAGVDVKAVRGYLRPLVADGKVQAFTVAVESAEAAPAE